MTQDNSPPTQESAPPRGIATRVLDIIEKITMAGAILALFVIIFAVSFQVVARYVIDSSTAWTPELAQTAFVWAALLAIPLGVRSERHMLVDLWRGAPDAVRIAIYTLASVIIVAVCAALVFFGVEMVPVSFRRLLPGLGISSGWQMVAVPVGFGLSLLFQLELLVRHLKDPRRFMRDDSIEAQAERSA